LDKAAEVRGEARGIIGIAWCIVLAQGSRRDIVEGAGVGRAKDEAWSLDESRRILDQQHPLPVNTNPRGKVPAGGR
jgi:hypothetical protein